MKTPTLIACTSLMAVATTAGEAQAQTPVELAKTDLEQAICAQDWRKASDSASVLIASPTIAPEERQSLVDWRHRFARYEAAGTQFESIPNCDRISASAMTVEPVNADISVKRVESELAQAICAQDWQQAADKASVLIASPEISAAYRQSLVTWRHRFVQYQVPDTKFDEIPNCQDVAVAPESVAAQDPYQDPYYVNGYDTWTSDVSVRFVRAMNDRRSCYMTDAYGQTISLSHLCGSNAASPSSIRF
jgi:hypothetical protein